VTQIELDPRELGIERSDPAELRGGAPAENATAIRRILEGERGAKRDAVVLNAAGALVTAGVASDLADGVARAADAVDTGAAGATLERLVAFSNEAPL
jgi:anthranilate phosphoribosyltransferase